MEIKHAIFKLLLTLRYFPSLNLVVPKLKPKLKLKLKSKSNSNGSGAVYMRISLPASFQTNSNQLSPVNLSLT